MTITSWEWTIYSTWAHELIPFFWCGSCCWFVSILCSICVVLFLLAIFTAIGKSSLCFVINQEWTMVLLIYIYDQLASIWQCYIQLISVLLLRTLFAVTVMIVDQGWYTKRQTVSAYATLLTNGNTPSSLTDFFVVCGLFPLVSYVA